MKTGYPGVTYMGGDFAVNGFFALSDTIMVWAYVDVDDPFPSLASCFAFVCKRSARLLPMYYVCLVARVVVDQVNGADEFSQSYWRQLIGDVLMLNCWIGEALDSFANLMWMIQSLFWCSFMFPFVVRHCHRHLLERKMQVTCGVVAYYGLLSWLVPIAVASVYAALRGFPFEVESLAQKTLEEPWYPLRRAIWRTRESPLARIMPLFLTVHLAIATKAEKWAPPSGLNLISWGACVTTYYFAWISPSYIFTERYFLSEFVGLPFMAVALPLLVYAERHGQLPLVSSNRLTRYLASASEMGLSFYCWQALLLDHIEYLFASLGATFPMNKAQALQVLPLGLGLSLVAGHVSLHFLEKPLSVAARPFLLSLFGLNTPKAKATTHELA